MPQLSLFFFLIFLLLFSFFFIFCHLFFFSEVVKSLWDVFLLRLLNLGVSLFGGGEINRLSISADQFTAGLSVVPVLSAAAIF